MSETAREPQVVTRDELYAQVWQMPISKLALSYGITGTGLAKICKRLEVPVPPLGYWAKKAAGKPVVQFRLSPPKKETPLSAEIAPTPPPIKQSPAIVEKIKETKAAAEVAVPMRLRNPHPLIASWIAKREQDLRDAKRERNPWLRDMTKPFTPIEHRRHLILDTIFKAAAKRGLEAKQADYRRLVLIEGNEEIEIQLRERQRQEKVPLPPGETTWNNKNWRQELRPTGLLAFEIKSWLGSSGIKKSWTDSRDKTIEDMVPEILSNIFAAGTALAEIRREREEERRRWEEAERRRREAEQQRRRNENRWARFLELAQAKRDAALAQELLKDMMARHSNLDENIGDRKVSEWLTWLAERIQAGDPAQWKVSDILSDLSKIGPERRDKESWHSSY